MTTKLSKTNAASLELVAQLAEHLSSQWVASSVSKKTVISWVLASNLDSRRAFTKAQRRFIHKRDGGKCFYCAQAAGANWQADHVLPWSRGGQTIIENGVVACQPCNNAKSNKVW